MYVTYEYYSTKYGGTKVSQQDFPQYELKARTYLKNYVLPQRIKWGLKQEAIKDQILICLCIIVDNFKDFDLNSEQLNKLDIMHFAGVSSESVKDHSISLSNNESSTSVRLNNELDALNGKVIRQYLSLTGLLYRGL